MDDAGQRPRPEDRAFPVAEERDREGFLKPDDVRRPDAFEEARSGRARANQHVVSTVDRCAALIERQRAPAEARRAVADDDLVPIPSEPAGRSHSREASSDDYDARHRNPHAAETESRCFSRVGSEARKEKTS
jgi:hypothetical protein